MTLELNNLSNINNYNQYIDKLKTNDNINKDVYNQFINMINNNKNKWLHYKHLSKLIINTTNGYIFGGFVRDSILHDHYASVYYNKHQELNISIKDAEVKYTNLNYFPEYIHRILLPTDIDIYLPNNNLKLLLLKLKEKFYEVLSHKIKQGKKYFINLDEEVAESLTHHILIIKPSFSHINNILSKNINDLHELTFLLNNINTNFEIKLDIFTSTIKYDDPFFGLIDFECNSLYLTKHGISISNKIFNNSISILEKNDKIQFIINDIISNKAVWANPTTSKRIYKMILKDWKIYNNKIDLVTNITNEICLLCKEDINFIDCKMKCCNGFLHIKCFIKLNLNYTKKNCIHCNT
jgi:hypothetical protein